MDLRFVEQRCYTTNLMLRILLFIFIIISIIIIIIIIYLRKIDKYWTKPRSAQTDALRSQIERRDTAETQQKTN